MRKILTMLVALLGVSSPALAQDSAAEAIEGAWVVSVGNQSRDRFLIVKGASIEKGEVLVKSAVYGWIDSKAKPVGDWKAAIEGDMIHLSFLTPADSLVKVSFSAADTSVIGDMLTKSGKKYDVRMTRLDAEELAALRAAAKGARAEMAKGPTISKNSKISLVYVGAGDCPPCKRFIGQVGQDGKGLKDIAPELAEARFVYVYLHEFRSPVQSSLLPEEMRWLMQPAANGRTPMRKRGTPFFVGVVDHRVIAQGHGTAALETLVAPAIKRAVEERRAAN